MDKQDEDLIVDGIKRIKQLIQDKNLKQLDLSGALDVSKKTVAQWLQESNSQSAQHLVELARLIGRSEQVGTTTKKNDAATPHSAVQASDLDHTAVTDLKTNVDLTVVPVEQLLAEIKQRYHALNLKADIQIHVSPLEGGFVSQD
ncbi:helix-turn-helix domain-containing protein [Acinetobacter larvae]|uniref:HTH cro/C1-type domain-containing protein n=1 Tax=Acinetobacter larvae TaxID=1789224 RepID=A0A1B2LW21_9GAMM|nr:helix-turn-helix transcriptional regulator [Acinetobacter larvae]AOA57127.1 hypothetical protein BFG52_01345 [Acinetobacter larvae]